MGDGTLDQDEAHYIEKIFDFGNRTVEDLMTPRSNVFFLAADMPFTDIVAELKRTRHTKVPVYREDRDTIQGILHARDLLAADYEALKQQPERLQELLHAPYFVPETKAASDLFHSFSKRKLSVALAVDEYGGVTGLISMEDLLECIFGDIPSPSDGLAEQDVALADDGTTRVDGALSITQFNKELGAMLNEGEFETVGGLILHELGELPEEGAAISLHDFVFTVETVEANRLKTLMVRKVMNDEGEVPEPNTMEGDN